MQLGLPDLEAKVRLIGSVGKLRLNLKIVLPINQKWKRYIGNAVS